MKPIYLALLILFTLTVGLMVAQAGDRSIVITTNRLSGPQAQALEAAVVKLLVDDPQNSSVSTSTSTRVSTTRATTLAITLSSTHPAAALQADLKSFLAYKTMLAKHAQEAPSPWSTEDLGPYQGVTVQGVIVK